MTHWVMIGFSKGFLGQLRAAAPGSVTVVEEPDVWRKKGLAEEVGDFPVVGEVLLAQYMEDDAFLSIVERAHAARPFSAVVPGLEYAVPAAAAAAERLGLPGAGIEAARTLRDKLRLRQVASAAGIPNPRFTEVDNLDDVRRFAGAGPVVLKPTGRQASLGVHLIESAADLDHLAHALAQTRSVTEITQIPDRALPTRILAEERLTGAEYSVEALVKAGEILFLNITEKTVAQGENPVELAHLVPAPLAPRVEALFAARMRDFVTAVGFGYGVLHAEWMLTKDRGPVLIECAGRVPGDHIFELIRLAYDFDPFAAVVDTLHGELGPLPTRATRTAGICFVTAAPGVVEATGDAGATRALPGVVDAALTARSGMTIGACRSSWDRLGHVIAVGATAPETRARLDAARDMLSVHTSPQSTDRLRASG
jgi:biotin carboxylase